MADQTEGRQDQNIDLGMSEKPEQMLVEQRVAATGRIEKGRAEIAVREQHRDGAGQNGKRQQQQEGCDQHRPYEQRHFMHGHAGRAHIENRGDEIDRTKDRRSTGNMQRQNGEIHRRARCPRGGQRRIDGPTRTNARGARRAFDKEG